MAGRDASMAGAEVHVQGARLVMAKTTRSRCESDLVWPSKQQWSCARLQRGARAKQLQARYADKKPSDELVNFVIPSAA